MLRTLGKRLMMAAGMSVVVATVAFSGPPWIAVEYPVNPHDPNTRGAFMTVRTYHHGEMTGYEISGTAEGLVNGRRVSNKLDIRRLPQTGLYAVRWTKPADGSWALLVTTARDGSHMASVLVDVDARGNVASVTVPARSVEGGKWLVPTTVAAAEVEAALRQ